MLFESHVMEICTTKIEIIKEQIIDFTKGKRVFICGVSAMGKTLAEWMDKNDIEVYAFIDKKGQADWTEKKVFNYEELKKRHKTKTVFFITQTYFKDEVWEELIGAGVPQNSIVTFCSKSVLDSFFYDLKKQISKRKMVSDHFMNIHKGERCFIIGNGPSLTMDDLQKLSEEYTFTVNSLYKSFPVLNYKPTYYFVMDRIMAYDFVRDKNELDNLLNHVGKAFFEIKTEVYDKYAESEYDNLFFYKDKYVSFNESEIKLEYFSEDITVDVFRTESVIYDVLQFACYMGFKEIYLLGIDLSFKNEKHIDGTRIKNEVKRNHASFLTEPEWYDDTAYEPVDQMEIGFLVAKKYADNKEILIRNATRGGKLEVFDRVEFDTLF